MIYMFLSDNPSSGDINLSNLSCLTTKTSKFSLNTLLFNIKLCTVYPNCAEALNGQYMASTGLQLLKNMFKIAKTTGLKKTKVFCVKL